MKKVKVYWPNYGKSGRGNNILYVNSLEDLMNKLKGFSYTVKDVNLPKGFDWVVKNMTRNKKNSCNC